MKKIFLFILICTLSFNINLHSSALEEITIPPTFSSKTNAENKVWVGTFQLVWNDFINEILKKPVKFIDGNKELEKQLNKKEFTSNNLSEKDYYKKYGKTSISLKNEIENDLLKKFGEKSEILDKIDWSSDNRAYVIYAMLKKDFEFLNKFNQLPDGNFGPYESKYFGINETSRAPLYKNVNVLFYNSPNDYAITLKTKTNDEVILYKTIENKSFNKLYKQMNKKTKRFKGNNNFIEGDELKIPYLSFKKMINYDSLCNRKIKNTNNLYIAKAIQTVDFELNETGTKLKSEAALDVQFMSFMPKPIKPGRNFYFNDTFVIFLKEKNKEKPYFAARIKDINLYNK